MVYETYTKESYQIIKMNEVIDLDSDIIELENIVKKFLEKKIINIALLFKDNSILHSNSATVILFCWKIVSFYQGEFVLINTSKEISNYLKMIAFDSLIKIYNSEEELELKEVAG